MGGRAGWGALPDLTRLQDDPDLQPTAVIALRLVTAGPAVDGAVPALAWSPRAGEHERRAAARALGDLGPAAGGAADTLRLALEDASPGMREAAREALFSVCGVPPH
jgi:hypothetical protein